MCAVFKIVISFFEMTPSCEKATFFMGSSIGFLFASGRMHEEKKSIKSAEESKIYFSKNHQNSTKIMEKRRKKIKLSFCEIF
jgi:hypothetical protein